MNKGTDISTSSTAGGDAHGSVELDADRQVFEYGHGGVPWILLLFYLSFLVFFVWYVFEYQVPDFLEVTGSAGEPAEVVQDR